MPLGQFLEVLASGAPAAGGGAAAALSVALGAGLCAMAARLSARRLGAAAAGQLTTDAERIRLGSASLMQADAAAYGRVISAMRSPAGPDPAVREQAVAATLSAAANVPMQVVQLGAEVAGLAARLAAEGNPALRGDAVAAATLAEAGARAAAVLVGINLASVPDDERHARAGSLLGEAARSAGAAARLVRLFHDPEGFASPRAPNPSGSWAPAGPGPAAASSARRAICEGHPMGQPAKPELCGHRPSADGWPRSASGTTNVPRPNLNRTRPSSRSNPTALRAVPRATPYRCISVCSDGIGLPGCSSPLATCRRRIPASCR
jgi:methenyltetrahydrofolate cyclohydrolase